MGRGLLLLLALAALGLVVWLMAQDPERPEAPRSAPPGGAETARLGGEPSPSVVETETATSSADLAIKGRVVDEAGEPIADAIVYLLPRNLPGADSVRMRTESGEDGRFEIPAGPWQDCRIGTRAPGYAVAHLEVAPVVEVVLRAGSVLGLDLGASDALEVERVRLRLLSSGEATWLYPGPGALPRIDRMVELAVPGVHDVPLAGSGPIEVHCDGRGLTWSPARPRVEQVPATVAMTFGPSSRVLLHVRQRSPRGPYLESGRLSAVDLATGEVVSVREGRGPGGRHVLQRQLPPGRYRIVFEAPGFLPWSSDELELPSERGETVLRARLARDEGSAEVRLAVADLYRAAWRRSGDREGAWRGAHVIRVDEGVRLRGIAAERIDLLVWERAGEGSRTALVDGLDLSSGEPQEPKPAWRKGVLLRPEGGDEALWRVVHERLGRLPVYVTASPAGAGVAWPRSAPGNGESLGPYPLDGLVLEPFEDR